MSERLTDAAIREAMARAEKATPGCGCEPAGWTTLPGHGAVIGAGDCRHHVCSSSYVSEFADPICEFIAAARTDVPALSAEALARGTEVERLRLALREIAICDQDYRPLPGEASPFDWRRRSMKQEDIARKALGGSL